ncbi:hypothetical protein GCM10023116_24800 [Kistimonas scapharcae]|uniref:Uncharacterized protein n=1 Tax=Kistimonas scapharcae TaxID=1036133 RepID=A0ABP8V2Z7_9GAMM
MATGRPLFHRLFMGVLLVLMLPLAAYALPPTQAISSDSVTIKLEHDGSNYYRFTAGEYHYRFLWDGGPTQLKIHGIQGYDTNGTLIDYAPAEGAKEGVPAPDLELSFRGVGDARYASTDVFRIPASFYLNRQIDHIAVDFSVVDGRMSIGPWLPMRSDWSDASSVSQHLQLLLW